MGFFTNKKGCVISDYFLLAENIGNVKANNMVEVALYEYYLQLSAPMIKTPITLKYSKITDVYYGYETEITEKNKSVIGRAVAGGFLFGNVGAVVGAISGSGKKEVKKIKCVFIISYKSDDGSEKFLMFEDTRQYKGAKLAKKLKEICNISGNQITEL